MFNPKINGSLEGLDFLKWVLARLTELMKFMGEVRAFMARMEKGNSAGARQTAIVNNIAREAKKTAEGTTGIPVGGFPGMTITRSAEGVATWTSTPYATIPEYHVALEQGAPDYYVNNSVDGDDTSILPPVEFDDDGTTMLSIQMDDYLQEAPITLLVEVAPHFDGEVFTIYVPAAASFYGGSAPYFILSVTNTSLLYTADVSFENNALRYAGTNVDVEDSGVRVFEPGENLYWFVQSGGADLLTSGVSPYPHPSGDVGFTDRKFTLEVASARCMHLWPVDGALAPAVIGVPLTNGTVESKTIGKLTAAVATAPTGSGVFIDAYLNGVSILSTPLEIPAGQTYAEIVPDASTTSVTAGGHTYPVVVFEPGDRLTVEITAVGATTPGTGLAVQVYYG